MITLITCDPAWTGTHRVIVTGVLVRAQPRAQTIARHATGSARPGTAR
jgi:sortase (surface protein transpeptidase)